MLKTRVKVGKVTNLSDARYCAGMGVDLLGFPVGTGPDAIDPKKYKEITEWVSGPAFVIEWQGDLPDDFAAHIQPYNADFIEIGVHQLGNIQPLSAPLIVRLDTNGWLKSRLLLEQSRNRIAYILLGFSSAPADLSVLVQVSQQFPVLAEIGASVNIDELSALPIAGISLEGSAESKPGLKDYQHLSAILERLEVTEE